MKVFFKTLSLLLASLILASCGGGGGSSTGAFEPAQSGSITLAATRTTLPVNSIPFSVNPGGPTEAEVAITWRNADGSLANTDVTVTATVNPTTVAGISLLDDPSTDTNEGLSYYGTTPVKLNAGQGTIFINSGATPGQATLVVSAVDSKTLQTVTKSLVFTITSSTGPQAASVKLIPTPNGVYLQGSNGGTSSLINATVLDANNQPVPDPVSGNTGFNNVKFEILSQAGSGTLSGNSQTGSSVLTHTTNGLVNVSFSSGTLTGPVQIRATVDRFDNNVDNGITDGLSSTTTVTVSDGKLFSLAITSPVEGAIVANGVSGDVTTTSDPGSLDGTYSLTISAVATDREGNPVMEGTAIQFGAIDSPVVGFPTSGSGNFFLSGTDGNPQESGTLFTSATQGNFTASGGNGAGPGDTLLIFGTPGNTDLEGARTVQTVNSATSLTVTKAFNPNDTTGHTVDNLGVLPYDIGRMTHGNITTINTTTNAIGVVHTTLNYPITILGQVVDVWAQGTGVTTGTGVAKQVGDVVSYVYPGIAPASLIASPSALVANITTPITVCVVDDFSSPLQGISISFAFSGLGVGSGSIDGVAISGVLPPTNAGGCSGGNVTTLGIAAADVAKLTFSLGDAEPLVVDIKSGTNNTLSASPSKLGGTGGALTLTLLDGEGHPISGVVIGATCSANVGLSVAPGVTNANGQTTATVTASLNGVGSAGTGTCTFSTSAAVPSTVVVNVVGTDTCVANPTANGCPDEPVPVVVTPVAFTIHLKSTSTTTSAISGTVTSSAVSGTSIQCSAATADAVGVATDVQCTSSLTPGSYTLTATGTGGTTFVGWSGSCIGTTSGATGSATVTVSAASTCTAFFTK